jgi:hypothetical protein
MVSSLQSTLHSGVSGSNPMVNYGFTGVFDAGGSGSGVVGNGPVHPPTGGIPIPVLSKGRFPGFPIPQGQPSGMHGPNPYHQGIQQVCVY